MARFIDAHSEASHVYINPGQVIGSVKALPQRIEGLGYVYLGQNSSKLYKKTNTKPSPGEAARGCGALQGYARTRNGVLCYNYWSSKGYVESRDGGPHAWTVRSGGKYANAADPKLAEDLFRFQWVSNTLSDEGRRQCATIQPPADIYNRNNPLGPAGGEKGKCAGADGILGNSSMCKIVQMIANNPDSEWGRHWAANLDVGARNMQRYSTQRSCTFNCAQIQDSRKEAVGCRPAKAGGSVGDTTEVIDTGDPNAGKEVKPEQNKCKPCPSGQVRRSTGSCVCVKKGTPKPPPPKDCPAGTRKQYGKCVPIKQDILTPKLEEESSDWMMYGALALILSGAGYYYYKKKRGKR